MARVLRCGRRISVVSLLATCLALGCGGMGGRPVSYRYFDPPAPDDVWSRKIARWQDRERAQDAVEQASAASPTSTVGAGPASQAPLSVDSLRAKYRAFRIEHRRELAREIALWVQTQSKIHYIPDGPIDHWATLEETLARNGDDCDGLELLAYHFLRGLGFRDDEVYRAIVYRPSNGEHHMVTMWFEDPDDPWVIDPTGAMTTGMPHMSEVPGWVPLKVFTETAEYTVEGSTIARAHGAHQAPASPAH
jgi:hypothetical protein